MSAGNSTYTLKATNAYGDTVELGMNLAETERYADRLKAAGIVPVVAEDAPMSVDRYYPVRIAQDGTKIRSGGAGPWYVYDSVNQEIPVWVNHKTKRSAQIAADARNERTR